MNEKPTAEIIAYRAELLAELFLQELNPSFITKPTANLGFDFFIGIQNSNGGINNYLVEVKAAEQELESYYTMQTSQYKRLAYSNIPALLLVIDVKRNNLHYALLPLHESEIKNEFHQMRIPMTKVTDNEKKLLSEKLAISTKIALAS